MHLRTLSVLLFLLLTIGRGSSLEDIKLVGTGPTGAARQGSSIALSSDGNTLAVGGYDDDYGVGATWIFTHSENTGWQQQGEKLVGTGNSGSELQGSAVALSSNGNTLAVGGPGDNYGAVWIFTRSEANSWTQQGAKLRGTGGMGLPWQGSSVALSADGNTLASGGYYDDYGVGATWIFTRSEANSWTQQGSKLIGTGSSGLARQGSSVAFSSDGNTLAVGGLSDNNSRGATWIFTRSGTTWLQQGTKLVGADSLAYAYQGWAVALSSDGNTLAVGGTVENNSQGATWIFIRSGSTWKQQGNKLIGSGATGTPSQGSSVSLSKDGNTLAVGGPYDNNEEGATWIFTRSENAGWEQRGAKMVGTKAINPHQGWSVALSADANTLAVSGYTDNLNTGAAWIFDLATEKVQSNNGMLQTSD